MSSSSRVALTSATFAAAAALFLWSVRGIDWRGVGESFRNADFRWVAVFLALASGALVLRAWRWRVLLQSDRPVSVSTVFWTASAGYFGNILLPARAGELVRTALLRSCSQLTASFVIATIVVERIADAIALLATVGIILSVLPQAPAWLLGSARAFLSFAIAAGVVALLLARGTRWIDRLRIPPSWKTKLDRFLPDLLRGLAALHQRRRFVLFAALTAAVWSLDAVATVVCGRALGFSFSLALAFLLIAAIGLGSAIPAPPGYVGVYQFIAVSVLTPLGFTRTAAITYILFAQSLSYLVIGVWGGIGLIRIARRLRKDHPA